MKKSIANITRAAILGLFVLGIFAGCAEILGGPPSGIQEDGPAAGKGRVLVSLGPQAEGARTWMPTGTNYEYFSYTYEFTMDGKDPVSDIITGGNAIVELVAGIWDLTVYGSDDGNTVLEGTVENIEVNAGASTSVQVLMKAFTENGDMGTLTYSVTFPDDVTKGTLTVYPWDSGENQGMSVDPTTVPDMDGDPSTKTVSGPVSLPAGYYRLGITLYKADGVFSQTDIAHVYPGLTTDVSYTIIAADFTPATVDTTGFTTLADVLDDINTLSTSDHKVYFLPGGTESMVKKTVSNSNVPVTVTIDGGGREVTLSNTGSLITVESNVTLVLRNIILKGNTSNTAALVTISNGGILELGTGIVITGNTNSKDTGGGVYIINNGTFTMNGGEISQNRAGTTGLASNSGGGVYVHNGTFTMNAGVISGNTAHSGAGVNVQQNGTFTMNGGEISHNTPSVIGGSGGGVIAFSTTFTMNGGVISQNSDSGVYVSSAGTFNMYDGEISQNPDGGVYVSSGGTFNMYDGEISENTAATGGGVYIASTGTFTIYNGEISYNTASGGGGGIYVDNATFTMNGGVISYNTASGGGGVYVTTGGTFTMYDGGVISENAAVSGGGGVVVSGGTFTMYDGGVISENTAVSGGGVYVTTGGTFTMNTGLISQNMVTNNGGGVYVYGLYGYPAYSGTFIMYDGEISRNGAYNGGGVGVEGGGSFTMSDGVISYNTADRYGGGVGTDGTFTMSGGEILGNTTANGFGGGVVIAGVTLKSGVTTRYGSFTMSGEARVNTNNAVGLVSVADSDTPSNPTIGTFLTIGGDFTGSDTVAKIDLLSWTDISSSSPPAYDWPGQTVLTLDNSYYGYENLSTLRNRFVLGNFANTDAAFSYPPVPTPITGYIIGADGSLQPQ